MNCIFCHNDCIKWFSDEFHCIDCGVEYMFWTLSEYSIFRKIYSPENSKKPVCYLEYYSKKNTISLWVEYMVDNDESIIEDETGETLFKYFVMSKQELYNSMNKFVLLL